MVPFTKYLEETKKTGCTCWAGHKRVPGTKPCSPGSCMKESAEIQEGERGLWDNIHAKQKRIKAGSGERMRKPGSKGAPTDADFKAANEEAMSEGANVDSQIKRVKDRILQLKDWNTTGSHDKEIKERQARLKQLQAQKRGVTEELSADEQFDLIEELVMDLAEQHNIDPETLWEKFEVLDDAELYEAAVDAKGYKSSTGGLTQKGRDAYNAKGANLQAPVTTPPSKLKPGSKAANRRKSFCARMSGMEGAMKKPNGEPTRKALALRKWNC